MCEQIIKISDLWRVNRQKWRLIDNKENEIFNFLTTQNTVNIFSMNEEK